MAVKRLKRPRDPIQLGKMIGDILTGQIEDLVAEPARRGKNPAAVALGKLEGIRGLGSVTWRSMINAPYDVVALRESIAP